MPRSLCFTRCCLGMEIRIEFVVRPLVGDQGVWALLCAAGTSGAQPSSVRAQGPFHGAREAEAILAEIATNLAGLDYVECSEMLIWRLHLQAELRRVNEAWRHRRGGFLSTEH